MAKQLAQLKIEDAADSKRRSVLIKQAQLTTKRNGRRHHTFDKEKAPYPLSYDRTAVDLDIIDHVFLTQVRNSVSFVDFEDDPPETCLDLGCGTGTWILDAMKEWPECEFVGFDLVNIQPPNSILDSAQAKRVRWVRGNFLTTKLPFEDDEFDHVHIRSIARAVPESKWDYLFEEISRVLRPGGSIEMIEDGASDYKFSADIRFPTLPGWYTRALRARERKKPSIQFPEESLRMTDPIPLSPPETPPPEETYHDHALLESLYQSVYETRFINLAPTAILPSYFSTYFRQVLCSPVINFPMPPLPPVPTFNIATSRRFSDASQPDLPRAPAIRGPRKESTCSTTSQFSNISFDGETDDNAMQQRTPPTSDDEASCHEKQPKSAPLVLPYYTSRDGSTKGEAAQLLPLASLSQSSQFMLALQLHRSYNFVLACEESMWEVLNDRIRNHEKELKDLGWDDDDFDSPHARHRFDTLLERYKGDMQTRAAIWQSLLATQSSAWKLPTPGFLGKAELNDEDRLYQSLLEAQLHVSEEELRQPCRTLRVFVGYNP
ncbi:S-adenosyl-L-methionine-dependent methyltransferase [Schizopora paradoxa]|uniref:S-adenosyl-L-methionine-dependent methyltransferase n=1 Tax=Schizopora paradoxa TaxID=27342 RepID=A0A0H2RZY7_9AGAM|nr:S-adenosyl-L-methionine-dependent methyltransferase [Schizopora paradoxa]